MQFVVIIPARFSSKRLMGKPLIKIKGKSLIVRTYNQCIKAVNPNLVYVATDDIRIKNECLTNNIKVIMTSKNCLTGTDRVYEASKKVKAKTYINVQGDEPIFNPNDLTKLIRATKQWPKEVITGYCSIEDEDQYRDINVPKVVISNNYVLYASRASIPSNKKNKFIKSWRQVCAYAFPVNSLKDFAKKGKKTTLENLEDLEYLRFLEMGTKLRALKMSNKSLAIDTIKDIKKAKKIIKS